MTKAAPLPFLGMCDQSALPVNIPKLLNELLTIPDVEIVITLLPKMIPVPEQEMDVLRHDDVAVDAKSVTPPHSIQRQLNFAPRIRRQQQRSPVITAEGDEMRLSGLMESFEQRRQGRSVPQSSSPTQAKQLEWATRPPLKQLISHTGISDHQHSNESLPCLELPMSQDLF